jgi:hypothetical protein
MIGGAEEGCVRNVTFGRVRALVNAAADLPERVGNERAGPLALRHDRVRNVQKIIGVDGRELLRSLQRI